MGAAWPDTCAARHLRAARPAPRPAAPAPGPNDFPDTAAVARALNDFERRYNKIAKPFEWNFTRADLTALLDRLDQREPHTPLAAAA